MYSHFVRRLSAAMIIAASVGVAAPRAAAQSPVPAPDHKHPPSPLAKTAIEAQQPPHDMQHMGHDETMAMPPTRDGSGTSWRLSRTEPRQDWRDCM
jgi:hypothetical protein